MPSLAVYRSIHGGGNYLDGAAMKFQSDQVIEDTWWSDVGARVAYLYDYYHDDEPLSLTELHSENSGIKIPVDIKYIRHTSQTYSKDVVTNHIMLRPSQRCNVDYYNEFFKWRYGAQFPVGLYIDIPDERGIYNRWLVVERANFNDLQLPTFEVLKCDKIIQYVFDGVKYQIPGVLRSQNSYNSGIWIDYATTITEDVQKFILPLNRDTEKIYYNQRLILDAPILTEPRAWQISKINRLSTPGIVLFTLSQTFFNAHTDLIEKDRDGNVVGMYADYYKSQVEPKENSIHEYARGEITYSGIKPQLKIGGSYKKFTVSFTDIIDGFDGVWTYQIDGADASSIITVLTPSDSSDLSENQIKIKAPNDDLYIGKVLTITYTRTDGAVANVDVEMVAL